MSLSKYIGTEHAGIKWKDIYLLHLSQKGHVDLDKIYYYIHYY